MSTCAAGAAPMRTPLPGAGALWYRHRVAHFAVRDRQPTHIYNDMRAPQAANSRKRAHNRNAIIAVSGNRGTPGRRARSWLRLAAASRNRSLVLFRRPRRSPGDRAAVQRRCPSVLRSIRKNRSPADPGGCGCAHATRRPTRQCGGRPDERRRRVRCGRSLWSRRRNDGRPRRRTHAGEQPRGQHGRRERDGVLERW